MAVFSSGIPRWLALTLALVAFATIPPEALKLGPDICLWKHLFGLNACPACGSTRALVAFFHGHLSQALAYNRNVIVTAPTLVGLLAQDAAMGVRRAWNRLSVQRTQPRLLAR